MSKTRNLQERFEEERDRRYAEVKAEQERALRIKEKADETALGLAREIQQYKDEKANELREQINEERSEMATKAELQATIERFDERHTNSRLNLREIVIGAFLVLAGVAAAVSPHIH